MRYASLFWGLLIAAGLLSGQMEAREQLPDPPVAKRVPRVTVVHGQTLVDDYYWLREKSQPEVLDYLKAENAYTDTVTHSTKGFQEALYREMLARIQETDVEVPYRRGEYLYYKRTEQGKQYPVYCRKKENLTAAEEVTLDLNTMADGQPFIGLGAYEITNNGHLLAYSTDTTGFRQYILHVKDLRTGDILSDTAERVTSVTWANDNKTLFFTQEDPVTKRSNKFYRCVLGSGFSELLFEEKDEIYDLFAGRTRSTRYIVLVSTSKTTSDARYLPADRPTDSLQVFLPRKEGHEYFIDHIGDFFYVRTNDEGKNFRLVSAPLSDPRKENWQEIIPHRPDVKLEDIDCFADHYVVLERDKGILRVRVAELPSGRFHYIEFPEPVYVLYPGPNKEFRAAAYRINYQSFITPSSIYDYDVKTRQRILLKQQPVLGGYDSNLYHTDRIFAAASDGTKVPVSIVYKKDLKLDGLRPMLLMGYGSYGISMDVNFSSDRLSLLDRGFIYGIAHVRGGGELGKGWHDQGKLFHKKNTFSDFIACAEWLIREKYTSPDRLIITGGSAGGLLMGAVSNMRPDLFRAVVSYVPFVDVINTMLDASLPLTTQEYLEWGNPNEKAAFEYIRGYSPYDNITAKSYPEMLIRTSLNDSQVMYWEPAKYVAKLRTLKTDHHALLLKVKLEPGGHGGASGRYDRLRDTAFDYAYIFSQLGIVK